MNILDKVNRIPPCLCRLLASKANGRQGLSHAEIAQRSGLSVSMVSWLSQKRSWDGVSIDTIVHFASACGINHLNAARKIEFWKRRKVVYLQHGTATQRRLYAKLMETLVS